MLIYIIITIVAALITILLIRALTFKTKINCGQAVALSSNVDESETVRKLSDAVRIKTISNIDYDKTEWGEFKTYHELMEKLFPLVHSTMEKETVNEYSLLYRWKGRDSKKKPILITAHMDVVPVEVGTENDWTCGPFSGDIKDGYV